MEKMAMRLILRLGLDFLPKDQQGAPTYIMEERVMAVALKKVFYRGREHHIGTSGTQLDLSGMFDEVPDFLRVEFIATGEAKLIPRPQEAGARQGLFGGLFG